MKRDSGPRLYRHLERPEVHEDQQADTLSLTVVFTTLKATVTALRRAAELADQLGAAVRVLIPQVVPYTLPIERPAFDPERTVQHFRNIMLPQAIQIRIEVCLCRDALQCVSQALSPNSVIVVGGRGWGWYRREHRIARVLRREGHHVIFVPSTG